MWEGFLRRAPQSTIGQDVTPHPDMNDLHGFPRLIRIIEILRGPDGCPWDREQTLATLKPFLIEECYELIDAVDSGNPDHHRDELGDVLLQVLLHAEIRREQGTFNIHQVADHLSEKLIRRHPHVFGSVDASTPDQVLRNWETIKASETSSPRPLLAGVPRHLPALHKAQRVQARAARAGFDWTCVQDVSRKLHEEIHEFDHAMAANEPSMIADELGDLFFTLVNMCRFLNLQAEDVLNHATAKFTRRYEAMETNLRGAGKAIATESPEILDKTWQQVKSQERVGQAPCEPPGGAPSRESGPASTPPN